MLRAENCWDSEKMSFGPEDIATIHKASWEG